MLALQETNEDDSVNSDLLGLASGHKPARPSQQQPGQIRPSAWPGMAHGPGLDFAKLWATASVDILVDFCRV